MPHFAFGLIKWTVSFSIFLGGCAQGETMFADYASSSNGNDDQAAIALVKQHAHRITGRANDYDPLLQMIGENRFVMLGEATHGTHEFYAERAKITQRLIKEKGFDAIVLEADWTDAFDVNRYVLGTSQARDADAALSGFTRFPKWMWANTDFRDLIANVRKINDSRSGGQHKVGVYGMDLYGADESALELTRYLQKVDESAAARARERYACLTSYRQGIEEYGSVVSRDPKRSCERPAIEQFNEMEQRYRGWLASGRRERNDELFSAYQNARVVKNGEAYFRRMREGGFSSWNHRDMHMSETINALAEYFKAVGDGTSKIVVWAHNSHQGDALMTDMGEAGELNVGHLMRKAHDGQTVLVGFTTESGRVMAAREWGKEGEVRDLRPAIPGSYARIFADTGIPDFLLVFRGNQSLSAAFDTERMQRAVGVVYLPESERRSHYFGARISRQFDAVIHFTETDAVKPLSRGR